MWDQLIIQKFKLFSGYRDEAGDSAIMANLQEAVKEETARFVVENLKENMDINILEKQVERIPFWRIRLNERINNFLDEILVKAKEIHGKRATT